MNNAIMEKVEILNITTIRIGTVLVGKIYGKINKNTKIEIQQQHQTIRKPIGYDSLINEIIMKMNTKRCILIEGEHGSGKTHIVKYCANQMKKEIYYYNCYQLKDISYEKEYKF